jgi:tRNA pseudouridine38-40 synthase
MRYFLHIAYSGTNYRGWQMQTKSVSVQEIFERTLSQVFKKQIHVVGCGRTDAEVHASQYFLHFENKDTWEFDLVFRLNKMLPKDIAVFDCIPVEADKHARFHAVKRTYDYFLHTVKDPFLRNVSTLYTENKLDALKMAEAVVILVKYNDYGAFCKTPDAHSTTLCKVTKAILFHNENQTRLRFQISSNRFLRGMIRILVGNLLQIGAGKMTLEEFEELLITKNRPKKLEMAHPQGLFLSEVQYPFLNIETKTSLSFLENTEWIPL